MRAYESIDETRHIVVISKLKLAKYNVSIGYEIGIKNIRHYITVENMIKLIKLGYVRGKIQINKYIIFRQFNNIKTVQIQLTPNETFTEYSDILRYIKMYNIETVGYINKMKEKISDTNEISISKYEKASLDRNRVANRIIEESKSNNMLYVCGLIRIKKNNCKGQSEIIGYAVVRRGITYNITKAYGIKLAKDGKIQNGKYNNHSVIGERVVVDVGNSRLPILYDIKEEQLLKSLTFEEQLEYGDLANRRIVGCIFNQIGKLVGLKVQIGQDIYNFKLDKFFEYAKNNKIRQTHGLTIDQYNKYKTFRNVSIRSLWGAEMTRVIIIPHQAMTTDMSKDLYGSDNTIIIDDNIDYGNRDIRERVLKTHDTIFNRIVKTNKNERFNKNDIQVIATVKQANIRVPFKITDTAYVVVKVNNDYFIMQRIQVNKAISKDLPFITIWIDEINYVIYNDGEYRVITSRNGLKQLKERITSN